MDILARNDTKVTKMNNAIMTSIPTKDELNAQKAAIASARLIPNVQYAPGSIVVSLQICVSCVGGLDIPEGCYEEFVSAGRKEGSQSHKHLQAIAYMSLFGATKQTFDEVKKRVRAALPLEASTASMSVTSINRKSKTKSNYSQTKEASLGSSYYGTCSPGTCTGT